MTILRSVLLLSLLTVAGSSLADTTWVPAGNISGVWDSTGSPYMIYEGHVTVATGNTLLIGPGVKVEFTGHYKFNVDVDGLLNIL